MSIQTVSQLRAEDALKQLGDGALSEIFVSYIQQLPVMIHQNGLGQAVAFYKSKGDEHLKIYNILKNWLCKESKIFGADRVTNDLLKNIVETDMANYRMAQSEAQAYLYWLRHIAKSKLKKEGGRNEAAPL